MRRFLPLVLLMAAVATMAACASGGNAGVALDANTGGRYLVMIPDFVGLNGDRVANELRALVSGSQTHVAINARDIERSMARFNLTTLDETLARQLGQAIQAQLVAWGEVEQGAGGLQADVKFIDSSSGDGIELSATGGTPREVAASLYASLERSFEGINQARFCNDNLSINEFQRALENCETALAIVPNNTAALYGKATALLNLDREEEALRVYEQLLGIDPLHQDALLGAGLAASRLDRRQQAMGFYNRYMEINPGNVQVRMAVAGDIIEAGDVVSAFRVLESAIADNRDNVEFQTWLFPVAVAAADRVRADGDSATARQIFAAAYDAYQAGFVNGGSEVDASTLRHVVAVTTALGRTEDALRLAQQATQQYPDDPQIWSVYANALQEAGRTDEEIRALTRLAEINPEHETVHARRAQAYLRAGQRQQAMADANRVAQRDRQMGATLLYQMGAQSAQAQNWTEAANILSSAHEYSSAEVRSAVEYLWGASLLQQAAAIARGNTNNNVAQIEQTLSLSRRAVQLLQSSGSPQASGAIQQAQQLIDNQEATLRYLRR